MLGSNRTFPAGTPIVIAMNLGMFDENIWGESTYEFDHNRENLVENHMMFHSVGNKHAGRMCPGKLFAMNMCSEITTECGKVRREKAKAL
jgi:cytochrome P450